MTPSPRVRTALALIGSLIAACAPSATVAPTASSAPELLTWPTVLELRSALAADYDLVRSFTAEGRVQWDVPGQSTPLEILGQDADQAEVTVLVDLDPGHDGHLEAVIAFFPDAVGDTAIATVAAVRAKIPTVGQYEEAKETRSTPGGTIEAAGWPDITEPIYVFFKPG